MAWKCKWCGEEVYEFLNGYNIDENKNTIYDEEPDMELFSGIYYCPNCKEMSAYDIEDIAKWEKD